MIGCYGFNEDFVFGDTFDGIGTTYNPAKFDDCILMQSTGLKDKNGKLIYEGDVVNLEYFDYDTKYRKAIVEWEDNGYCVTYIKPTDTKVTGSDLTSWFPKVEVIGNIYQDSQLLDNPNNSEL